MRSSTRLVRLTLAASFFAAVAISAASLGGCNTIEGAGKDTAAAGDAISEAARDTEAAMKK